MPKVIDGVDATPVGVVTFRGVSTQTVFAELPIGENQTQMAAFTGTHVTGGFDIVLREDLLV